jgi:hypothetical protein
MFRSSWGHHQAVYITSTTRLTEISIWIHTVVKRVYIIKVVEDSALCHDEKITIQKTIGSIRLYKIYI